MITVTKSNGNVEIIIKKCAYKSQKYARICLVTESKCLDMSTEEDTMKIIQLLVLAALL